MSFCVYVWNVLYRSSPATAAITTNNTHNNCPRNSDAAAATAADSFTILASCFCSTVIHPTMVFIVYISFQFVFILYIYVSLLIYFYHFHTKNGIEHKPIINIMIYVCIQMKCSAQARMCVGMCACVCHEFHTFITLNSGSEMRIKFASRFLAGEAAGTASEFAYTHIHIANTQQSSARARQWG